MIPRECRRLAEVDFPIAEVSKHAVREKSIRHGHPSTLHLWWARRPLASCRALLLGLLWPDPCDPLCPQQFKDRARELLGKVPGCNPGSDDESLRRSLLRFMADFASWDLATHPVYLEVARGLVRAAYPEEPPLVVDPFAGGGSIPLEALRVGCEAFGSDLNPVACLVLKVLLEQIPRLGPELATELVRVATEIKQAAESEMAELYPRDPDGAIPIAYIWARTVRCEAPSCGAEIPLSRSFWLCKKAHRRFALRYRIERPTNGPPAIHFDLIRPNSDEEVPKGTVSRAKAICPACGAVLSPDRVRAQLAAQRGGADVLFDEAGRRIGGARMMAVVTVRPGGGGRYYRLPTDADYNAVRLAQQRLAALLSDWKRTGESRLCPVPDEPLPPVGTLGFRVQKYGMLSWGDLFTARQKLALAVVTGLARRFAALLPEQLQLALAILVDRLADGNASLCRWLASREEVKNVFSRQALPIVWDFAEAYPLSEATRGYAGALELITKVITAWPGSERGQVQLADAAEHPLPDQTADVWFTDPPYYDAVPYAALSDFFLVWLKRTLPGHPLLCDPFDLHNPLSPKSREAIQDKGSCTADGRPKDKTFYEETMSKAFSEGRRLLKDDGVASVIFAHKTTEGWEALLSGLVKGGWTITASWPVATEMGTRLRARDSAALATSVHLVCRPRSSDAPVGDWADVLRELPKRVGDWMERLQAEGVRGADLVFACIGPALETFSRYRRVETAEGHEIQLSEYLEKVWEIVGRTALENVLGSAEARARNGTSAALEEDARLTALFLWTLQTSGGSGVDELDLKAEDANNVEEAVDEEDDEDATSVSGKDAKGYSLTFDVVRRFAQPLGIDLPRWEGRLIKTHKGVVRLLPIRERARVLLGKAGADAIAQALTRRPQNRESGQLSLFLDEQISAATHLRTPGTQRAGKGAQGEGEGYPGATTLDRLHIAMLLQASGQTAALRALLQEEKQRGPHFFRLANALSALYPRDSEEKRLLDAMLLAVPR